MKKLFVTLFAVLAVFVANAQTDSLYILDDYVLMDENYNFDEEYVDLTNWCADTLIIYDDDPYSIEIGAVTWYSYNVGQWLMSTSSITITKENEGRWTYQNNHTGMAFDFMITLATTPEETKVSFEREVPLEPCGTEIFAYDLIDGEENPRLTCLWDDGETSYSRIVYDDGTYTVTVSDSCGRQVTNTWFVGDWTGTHETVSSATSIFPNPAHGAFTVRGEGTLVIFNSIGQKVREMKIDNEAIIDGLPAGMYFVQVNGSVKKIVVE